jgi:hypothetical protein
MKKVLFLMLFLTIVGTAGMNAQVKIGENTAPRKGALLDLNGLVKGGLLLPNVDIDDLSAIPVTFTDPAVAGQADAPELTGMIVWNTHPGVEGVYMWNGTEWKIISGGGTTEPPADCTTAPSGTSISGFSGTYNLNAEFEVICNATTAGVTLYTWDVTGLTLVSGQGTNRIILKGETAGTFVNTSISCEVRNTCGATLGTSTTGITVRDCSSVPATPGDITLNPNPINVGQTTTATVAAVTGATSYVWTLPAGLSAPSLETAQPSLVITGKTQGTY